MPEIDEELVIEFNNDCLEFSPRKTGSDIRCRGLALSRDQSATLAWLAMNGPVLEMELRVKA